MTIGELGKRVSAMIAQNRPVKTIVEENASDRRNYAVSFDKISNMLGYKAKESLESGIQEMIEHFHQKTYGDYRNPVYSNLAVTREAAQKFKDPEQRRYLYEPLAD
jgi:dTDP-D-glucose 4,6-dehydratase